MTPGILGPVAPPSRAGPTPAFGGAAFGPAHNLSAGSPLPFAGAMTLLAAATTLLAGATTLLAAATTLLAALAIGFCAAAARTTVGRDVT